MKYLIIVISIFLISAGYSQNLLVLADKAELTDEAGKNIAELNIFDVVTFIKKDKGRKGKVYVEKEGLEGWIDTEVINYYENYKRKELQKGRSILLPSGMKYEYYQNIAGKVEGVPYVLNEYKVYNDDLFINNIIYPISVEKKITKFKSSTLNKDARITKINYKKEIYFIDNLFNSEMPACPIYILIYKIDETHSGSINIILSNDEDIPHLSLLAKKILFSIE